MFEATLFPSTTMTASTPTTPPPEPTKTFTAFPVMTFTKTAPAPMPFTCTSTLCTTTDGATDFAFRMLQNLINMANAQLARSGKESAAAIGVDGKLDTRTLSAYMPVSRGIGGTLAIFDFTPDPKYLATNALAFSQTIAQWLGMTWVAATTTVPGHWERIRVGGSTVLPTYQAPAPAPAPTVMPTPTAPPPPTSLCPPGSVATSRGCIPSAPPPPTQPTSTPQPQPQPQQAPQAQPSRVDVGPTMQPSSQPLPQQTLTPPSTAAQPERLRYAGCIARFNKSRKVFAIYCPIASPSGFGIADDHFRCLFGNCGLGADTVTPPIPAGFVKAAETTALPQQGETPAGEESDKFFRANNPFMWLTVAGVAAALGGGGYVIYRRRKHA